MVHERLRQALDERGLTHEALAVQVEVDPKTVQRWVRQGRVPHRQIAERVATVLHEDPQVLWPQLRSSRQARAVHPELVALYPRRADVPADLLPGLVSRASHQVDVLIYAAVHLHEQAEGWNDLLREAAARGAGVRIALGDAESPNVAARGREERFGHGIESRCRLALLHYRPLLGAPGIEVRIHGTTLYNSLYRVDSQMLVNAHLWGVNAYGAPVWQLRHTPAARETIFGAYADSFDQVWSQAAPVPA
jgi:transcriptional regulator with XRE-family HTH domain